MELRQVESVQQSATRPFRMVQNHRDRAEISPTNAAIARLVLRQSRKQAVAIF